MYVRCDKDGRIKSMFEANESTDGLYQEVDGEIIFIDNTDCFKVEGTYDIIRRFSHFIDGKLVSLDKSNKDYK